MKTAAAFVHAEKKEEEMLLWNKLTLVASIQKYPCLLQSSWEPKCEF